MNQPTTLSTQLPSNPFSAKMIRPGAIPFLFPENLGWSDLEVRFRDHHYHGQVVGPHGTGKSTLFAEWQKRLEGDGWQVVVLKIYNSANSWSFSLQSIARSVCESMQLLTFLGSALDMDRREALPARASRPSHNSLVPREREGKRVVMIDGFEQLAAWQRWCVRAWLRFRNFGLLVTTHRDLGLPTMFQTMSSPELAVEVANRIATLSRDLDYTHESGDGTLVIPVETVQRLWREHRGDIRETLFSLYDWYRMDVELIAPPAKSA